MNCYYDLLHISVQQVCQGAVQRAIDAALRKRVDQRRLCRIPDVTAKIEASASNGKEPEAAAALYIAPGRMASGENSMSRSLAPRWIKPRLLSPLQPVLKMCPFQEQAQLLRQNPVAVGIMNLNLKA